MSNKWSLKRIGKYFYLYSFCYKPVMQRKKRKKKQRYEWEYHGKIGSTKSNKYISRLPNDEQEKLYLELKQKEEELNKLEDVAKKLEAKKPFIHQKNEIFRIKCLKEQHNAMRRFHNKLLTAAKIQLEKKNIEKGDRYEQEYKN